MQFTTKGMTNKVSHLQISKPRIQMSSNISLSANPWKLTPTNINDSIVRVLVLSSSVDFHNNLQCMHHLLEIEIPYIKFERYSIFVSELV